MAILVDRIAQDGTVIPAGGFFLVHRDQAAVPLAETIARDAVLSCKFLGADGADDVYLLLLDLRRSSEKIKVSFPEAEDVGPGRLYYTHVRVNGQSSTVLRADRLQVRVEPQTIYRYTDSHAPLALSTNQVIERISVLRQGGRKADEAFCELTGQGKAAIALLIEASGDKIPVAGIRWGHGFSIGHLQDPPAGIILLYLVDVIVTDAQSAGGRPAIVPCDFSIPLQADDPVITTSHAHHAQAIDCYRKWWLKVKNLDMNLIRKTIHPLAGSGLRWVDRDPLLLGFGP
ncbi:MAG: hypothetical protein JXR37_03090 [Kiritimatiellae bacterium]|nr:hypothetical protein [Kiritimatiellia bacterium]